MIPWQPFAMILVFNPRPKRPNSPSAATTSLAAVRYPTLRSWTWRYVLTTRKEFETVSEIRVAQNPMNACRHSSSPLESCFGSASWSKLYVANH